MVTYWKAHRFAGIDFVGEITDLDGQNLEGFTPLNLPQMVPTGWRKSFIWRYWTPGNERPLLIQRDIYLWGQNVDKLIFYVENNYTVLHWSPESTEIQRFPTYYPHSPTVKIIENDSKKQDFFDLSTFPHHNKGYIFEI